MRLEIVVGPFHEGAQIKGDFKALLQLQIALSKALDKAHDRGGSAGVISQGFFSEDGEEFDVAVIACPPETVNTTTQEALN